MRKRKHAYCGQFHKAFLFLHFMRKNIGVKAALRMLVKLTPGHIFCIGQSEAGYYISQSGGYAIKN